jgi:hypothetical protein
MQRNSHGFDWRLASNIFFCVDNSCLKPSTSGATAEQLSLRIRAILVTTLWAFIIVRPPLTAVVQTLARLASRTHPVRNGGRPGASATTLRYSELQRNRLRSCCFPMCLSRRLQQRRELFTRNPRTKYLRGRYESRAMRFVRGSVLENQSASCVSSMFTNPTRIL